LLLLLLHLLSKLLLLLPLALSRLLLLLVKPLVKPLVLTLLLLVMCVLSDACAPLLPSRGLPALLLPAASQDGRLPGSSASLLLQLLSVAGCWSGELHPLLLLLPLLSDVSDKMAESLSCELPQL
jgi:hypothetical protein